MSAAQQKTVAAITLARNYILYGAANSGAALEGLEVLAPMGDIISGPLALASAVQVCGWQAQYIQSRGYIQRALTNSMIGSV